MRETDKFHLCTCDLEFLTVYTKNALPDSRVSKKADSILIMDLSESNSEEFDLSDFEDGNELRNNFDSPTDDSTPLGQQLINAILERKFDVAELLLKDGADSNYNANNNGWSPLMFAASLGAVQPIRLLLAYGADAKYELKQKSALMCLCESSCFDENQLLECLDILVDNDADINSKDNEGLTPLMMAVKRGRHLLVTRLLDLGCNIETETPNGWTAIFFAVSTGDSKIVKILIDAGCNLSLMNKNFQTVHDLASESNFQEILEILSEGSKTHADQIAIQLSNYEFVLSELPENAKSSYKGFVDDTLKTLDGIGLEHLIPLFIEKKIGFGQFLTFTEKDWKNVGVEFSYDRKKLMYYAYCLVKRHWSRNCIIELENHELNLFWIAKILSNNIRIMHIIRATLHVCCRELERNNNQIDFDRKNRINYNIIDCCAKVKLLNDNLERLSIAVKNIADRENIVSVDFISNRKYLTLSKLNRTYHKVCSLSIIVGFSSLIFYTFRHLFL